jgi:translation initiation factor 1 (eIF-1/SUI1)
VSGNSIDVETIRTLARLQGLQVPEEDLEPLAAALASQFAAGGRILERFGDSEAEPPLIFDPRWE